ncbi:jg3262 [Pararge aegeria aegeria]|uniref:Jg3262 protein n=1 Tax=Pararge aegeria aegeria TaxID=348720 RepID=A0A8S4RW85_9NEOP|nr:jg3262 [Pararge aegeria aegeria]
MMQPKVERACPEDAYSRFEVTHIVGTGENGSWKSIPDPSSADQKRRCEVLRTLSRYIDHVGMQILTVPRGSMVKRRGGGTRSNSS